MGQYHTKSSVVAFVITGAILTIVHVKVQLPMLLLERFMPGMGPVQIVGLSAYTAWLTSKLITATQSGPLRRKLWSLFSIVFFLQFVLGISGLHMFLMTGKLHLPVPALIAAGPIFRGSGFFMPILLGATLLLVGPAWCSHLCYIGALDNACANGKKKPMPLSGYANQVRVGILVAVLIAAVLLRITGVSTPIAASLALVFGLVGVAIMLTASRRTGTMVHCTVYCPIGLLVNGLGKLSPFRIQIGDACTKCGKCSQVCRYSALSDNDIKNKTPALTCTLCGDCVGACSTGQIHYRFLRLSAKNARALFITLVVSLHGIFLGLARI